MSCVDITEITTKTALVRSRIPGVEYVLNPYTGCEHACSYCYAVFMRKYSRHHKDAVWGEFVEAKMNIMEVLSAELSKKRKTARAMLSSVCDPYQPAERQYELTRGCIEILRNYGWGVDILTRSPLVIRDTALLASCINISVGFSIPTDNDDVRRTLEPAAPSIPERIEALRVIHNAGIPTWVFVAPILPMNPERLSGLILPYTSDIMFDPLNYKTQAAPLFRRHGWDYELTDNYAKKTAARLKQLMNKNDNF